MPAHVRNVSPLADAVRMSAPLARLAERMRESRERFDCIRALLPAALADQVRPGPIDADGWTLLATNPAVSAKLRQFVPDLQAAIEARNLPALPFRIKVLPA